MAINPLMLPQIIGMGGQRPQMQQPMAPQPMQQPQAPQGPDSLAELTRLLGGDLSGSLTGGDKLLALSGLLRSATRSGRRAGLTPEQVISGLQQRKVAEVQNRLAIEQMRAKMAQEQQANAAWQDYVSRQSETRRAKLAGIVDPQERQKILAAEPRPFQVTKSGGNQFMVFANPDGTTTSVPLDIPRDVQTTQIDVGDKTLIVDKDTGETIREYDKRMSPAEVAADERGRANIRLREIEVSRGGGGGGGSAPQTQLKSYYNADGTVTQGEVRWNKARDSWVDRAGNPVRLAPSAAPGYNYAVPPATGGRRFGN